MHNTKKQTESKIKKEKTKDESKTQDEKLKKSIYTVSTPRDYVQKSSYADIYSQKKTQVNKAPKKTGSTQSSTISPMKGLLKSSSSSISINKPTKSNIKATNSARNDKKLPLTNVTVNSPITKRKLEKSKTSVQSKEVIRSNKVNTKEVLKTKKIDKKAAQDGVEVSKMAAQDGGEVPKMAAQDGDARQRTKTRTLEESEVKILKHETVDNNSEMLNLTKKLAAKPKAFYVDLDDSKEKTKTKSSDEEVSYEDDFESYESDFDSYHSEQSDASVKSSATEKSGTSEASERGERGESSAVVVDKNLKEGKDEESMLDSGSFDLRDRSAKAKPILMENILEGNEDDKRVSLTDEGFQEMSSSSAVSSMKNIDSLDRPIFLDFKKAKQLKAKRLINERLKQRANDLLPMISLHEMYFSLFEMQPISYDLYMATFGKNNYTQMGVQTFDDGITEEVQTEEVLITNKWTQHPVEFSKYDITYSKDESRKYSKKQEDYLTKFTFLIDQNIDYNSDNKINSDENYKTNPLRMYFEQKDGAGGDEMLPYEIYKSKLKNKNFNTNKLGKFLKKYESRIIFYLNKNVGSDLTGLIKTSKLPFSKGYISVTPRLINNETQLFLKNSTIVNIFLSDTKSNLLLTEHKNAQFIDGKKSLICLWDLSVAREPVKILSVIDNVVIARYNGNTDGILVAALDDCSIHLWDLTEEPNCQINVASVDKSAEFKAVDKEGLTVTEQDRLWNLENSNIGISENAIISPLQSCAYTNSALNMNSLELDRITGLVINTEAAILDSTRRLIGQVISLQSTGIMIIWSILQEKIKSSTDIGKAYWSKMRLEIHQTIKLYEHIDTTMQDPTNIHSNFNLNSAKRRLTIKKTEKVSNISRPKTAAITKFDVDRPSSAANIRKKILPAELISPKSWENGIVCNDLKVVNYNNVNYFLIAKNGGEVLSCRKCLGVVRVERFSVSMETSSVISVEVSNRPEFLATTDCGTVNLCSLLDNRVLLTLDCRNIPPSFEVASRCQSDHKGRYIGTVVSKTTNSDELGKNLSIKSVHWSTVNPCSIHLLMHSGAMVTFDLTRSDINATHVTTDAATHSVISDGSMALLTREGEVQVHRLFDDNTKEYANIYRKYVNLL